MNTNINEIRTITLTRISKDGILTAKSLKMILDQIPQGENLEDYKISLNPIEGDSLFVHVGKIMSLDINLNKSCFNKIYENRN